MTPSHQPLIAAEGLTRSFGSPRTGDWVEVLRGIDVTIPRGTMLAVVGPSGCGKTSLLYCLSGLDRPDGGRLRGFGADMASMPSSKLAELYRTRIGFVFQSFNLISRMSALKNVEIPMIYAHKNSPKERAERAEMLLEKVGLGGRIHHQPNEMSGGQRQRVAIARALTNEPPLILADEPTGNLDTASSVEIMEMFSALHRAGATVVVVTHEENIAAYTDRMLRFSDGRLISDRDNPNPTPVRDLSSFQGMYHQKGENRC